jgi:hypothetical protein
MKKSETSAMRLSFHKGLLQVTFKEKCVIDQKDVHEFLAAAKELVGDQKYMVLTDGRAEHFMLQAAQELLKQFSNPNRLANAILTRDDLTEKRVQVFINSQVNPSRIRQFKSRESAVAWLERIYNDHVSKEVSPTLMLFPESQCTEWFEVAGTDVKVRLTGLEPGIKELLLVRHHEGEQIRIEIPTHAREFETTLPGGGRFWFEYEIAKQQFDVGLHINDAAQRPV